MSTPDVGVSVIIPTYNSCRLLATALAALRAQQLPAEQFEVIVVDDGSTDGSWDELQAATTAWPQLRIFQQDHAGKPSVGRNLGLGHAVGRYVFFHDADDTMPPYALGELLDRGDRADAEVVAGQIRNIGGSGHQRSWLRDSDDADLIEDGVWSSLSTQKLFRRDLLQRLGLQFCEDMVQGEDQIFAATALLRARRVCAVAERDYYLRLRERGDGQNLSRRPQPLANKVLTCTRITEQIEACVPADRQPAYFDRVLLRTLAPALGRPFMRADPVEQQQSIETLQHTVLQHLGPRQLARTTDERRLRLLVAAAGRAEDLVGLNQWWHSGRGVQTVAGHQVYDPPRAVAGLLRPADLRVGGPDAPPRERRRFTDRLRRLLVLLGARRIFRGHARG